MEMAIGAFAQNGAQILDFTSSSTIVFNPEGSPFHPFAIFQWEIAKGGEIVVYSGDYFETLYKAIQKWEKHSIEWDK